MGPLSLPPSEFRTDNRAPEDTEAGGREGSGVPAPATTLVSHDRLQLRHSLMGPKPVVVSEPTGKGLFVRLG